MCCFFFSVHMTNANSLNDLNSSLKTEVEAFARSSPLTWNGSPTGMSSCSFKHGERSHKQLSVNPCPAAFYVIVQGSLLQTEQCLHPKSFQQKNIIDSPSKASGCASPKWVIVCLAGKALGEGVGCHQQSCVPLFGPLLQTVVL